MGDSNNSTEPKGGSSTQGGGEVDPNIRLPSFKPPRDLTLTKPDSVETKKKRKSSLGRPSKKSKGEKGKSEGMEISIRRSGRNAASTAPEAQKVDEDDKMYAKDKMSAEEKKIEEQLLEEVPVQSAQEQKTDGDKEKKDENVYDPKEEMLQEQLAEQLMEDAAGVAPNTEPQPEEQGVREESAAEEERRKDAEDKENMNEEAVIIQILD